MISLLWLWASQHLPMQETWETWVRLLGQEDSLEEGVATHSSIPAWRISWTEKPGGLQSVGLQRLGHNWRDSALYYTSFLGGSDVKESACSAEDPGSIPELGRSPGERNGYHASILVCRISWKEEPGGLQFMGSQRVRHNWATNTFTSLCLFWDPVPPLCLPPQLCPQLQILIKILFCTLQTYLSILCKTDCNCSISFLLLSSMFSKEKCTFANSTSSC